MEKSLEMRKFKKKRVRNEEILILKKKVVAYNNKISFEKNMIIEGF